ncbi:MAG TPA: hypothetical protein VM223_21605 [Planctomycetota bacterium]|nr:hypothetical protein [Planctomycetota bacterium]
MSDYHGECPHCGQKVTIVLARSLHVTATDYRRREPDSLEQIVADMRGAASVADRFTAEAVKVYAERIKAVGGSHVAAMPTATTPDAGSEHKRICEFCFRAFYGQELPKEWDFVWQSAVCPDCRERVQREGGYGVVKGGAYATIPDPRKLKIPDIVAPPAAEMSDVKWAENNAQACESAPDNTSKWHFIAMWFHDAARRFRANAEKLAQTLKESHENWNLMMDMCRDMEKLNAELATAKQDRIEETHRAHKLMCERDRMVDELATAKAEIERLNKEPHPDKHYGCLGHFDEQSCHKESPECPLWHRCKHFTELRDKAQRPSPKANAEIERLHGEVSIRENTIRELGNIRESLKAEIERLKGERPLCLVSGEKYVGIPVAEYKRLKAQRPSPTPDIKAFAAEFVERNCHHLFRTPDMIAAAIAEYVKLAPDAECERLAKWCEDSASGWDGKMKADCRRIAAILRTMKRHIVEYENTPDGHTPLYVDGVDVSPGTRWGKTYLLMLRALLVRCGFEMAERKSEVKP